MSIEKCIRSRQGKHLRTYVMCKNEEARVIVRSYEAGKEMREENSRWCRKV
jgi:hypothetical protein